MHPLTVDDEFIEHLKDGGSNIDYLTNRVNELFANQNLGFQIFKG